MDPNHLITIGVVGKALIVQSFPVPSPMLQVHEIGGRWRILANISIIILLHSGSTSI
jgi:hypothetical protein